MRGGGSGKIARMTGTEAREFRSGFLGGLGIKVMADRSGITEGIGPLRRTIPWSDVRELRVARPGGLLPGVTVVVTRVDGSETALMSLALDLLPSSAAAHERLRGIAADLAAARP